VRAQSADLPLTHILPLAAAGSLARFVHGPLGMACGLAPPGSAMSPGRSFGGRAARRGFRFARAMC
jgi:hypothetical protein